MRRPRVEILYFEDCPNHEPARALVERIAAELGVEPEIQVVEVPDADAAMKLLPRLPDRARRRLRCRARR